MNAPINRPRIRAEIRQLERRLSETNSSSEREPILAELERKQAELHRYYARLRTLPRFDAAGNRLPGFSVHAPLGPDKERTP